MADLDNLSNGHCLHSPIQSLSTEVLDMVVGYVYHTSRSTMSSLEIVSRFFYELTLRYRGRNQFFTYDNAGSHDVQRKIAALLEAPTMTSVVQNIRAIQITASRPNPRIQINAEYGWEGLIKLIARIPKLKFFHFRLTEALPTSVLAQLKKYHPNTYLAIGNIEDFAPPSVFERLDFEILSTSHILMSIKIEMRPAGSTDRRLMLLLRLLKSAPNLREVYVILFETETLSFLRPEYITWNTPTNNIGEGANVLRRSKIKALMTRGKNIMRFLDQVLDLTELEILLAETIKVGSFWARTIESGRGDEYLGNLQSLQLVLHTSSSMVDRQGNFIWATQTANQFIKSCKKLKALIVHGRARNELDYSDILRSVGPGLDRLCILGPQRQLPISETNQLDAVSKVLNLMLEHCPQLGHIGVDFSISPDGQQQQILTILSQFTQLRRILLQVFEQERTHGRRNALVPGEPLRDLLWIDRLWSDICVARSKNGQRPLKGVTILDVETTSAIIRPPRHTEIYVSPSVRDDRPDEILVVVSGMGEESTKFRQHRKVSAIED